jgi:CheY-like chemotaxis protein
MDIAQHIATVYNGRQALDFLEANCAHPLGNPERFCPAFILLDLNMPVMDGFEFLEAFQTKYAACSDKITICILSSSSAQRDKLKASEYHISGFLIKPLTEENLIPILEKM